MFTGIVQATGSVQSIQRGSAGTRLVLDAPDLARPIPDGASVCVSGVCLTVTRSDPRIIEFDVVPETVTRSTIGALAPNDRVNLERSLRPSDGIDGHIVQGHVDAVAEVVRVDRDSRGWFITCRLDRQVMPFVIPKGSIAIDGVSLTIADVGRDTFSVALIPTTAAVTTLGNLRSGDKVNIETDILARTVVATLERWKESKATGGNITMDMLREQGFV